MNATKIEWCDVTINPIVGCSKCSPGCDNCYAERFAARMAKHPNPKISRKYAGVVDEHGKWTGKINGGMDMSAFIGLPKKPSRIFVGSMTDIFHPNLDDNNGQGMRAMLQVMWSEPHHTFMLLTKRPDGTKKDIEWLIDQDGELPDNLWLGVTVCNQAEADTKVPLLLQTPAAKRFVSVEPMLGPVDLDKDEFLCPWRCQIDIPTLDWVICGGETGPNARPIHPNWARSLRDQCAAAGVPFFFKSWGEWAPRCNHPLEGTGLSASGMDPECTRWDCVRLTEEGNNGSILEHSGEGEHIYMQRVGKKLAGRRLDGVEHNEAPA